MAWAIRRFGTAAVLGEGVQDYGTLSAIAAAENVWHAWQGWASAEDKTAWARRYPAADALLRELLAKIGL